MSLYLYRRLLRDISGFPVGPVRRKLKINVRLLFEVHSGETNPDQVTHLRSNALAAVRVLAWLKSVPKVQLSMTISAVFLVAESGVK